MMAGVDLKYQAYFYNLSLILSCMDTIFYLMFIFIVL
jgi:hypothetical protein